MQLLINATPLVRIASTLSALLFAQLFLTPITCVTKVNMTVTSWQSVFRTQSVTESTIASVLPVTKETETLNLSLETLLSFKLTVLFHLALMDLKAA